MIQKSYIYKITSPVGKTYIGQTINYKKRFKDYKYDAISNQKLIYRSIKKYGYENHKFEIIEELYCTKEELNLREIHYIEKYNTYSLYNKDGLNLRKGGRYGYDKNIHIKTTKGRKLTEERKSHLREINLYGKNPACQIILDTSTGIYYESIVEAAKSKNININTLKSWLINKPHKTTLRYAFNGKRKINTRKSLGLSQSKLVLDFTTGVYFYSIKEAAESYNIKSLKLIKMLNGVNINKTNLKKL